MTGNKFGAQLKTFATTVAAPLISSNASGEGGAFSKSAVRPKTPPSSMGPPPPPPPTGGDRLRRRERVSADEAARKTALAADVDDLIHLGSAMPDAIDEDSVVRALQARFFNQKYFVRITNLIW